MSIPGHSTSIEKAKFVKESISDNYTSSQLIGMLDTLLFRALDPIIRNTALVDRLVANLVSLSYGRKRKITAHEDISKSYRYLGVFLFTKNGDEKIEALQRAKVERSLLFLVLDLFLLHTKEYLALSAKAETSKGSIRFTDIQHQLATIERGLGATRDLYSTVTAVKFWQSQAALFKQQLAEKYLRHAVNRTVTLNRKSGFFNIDLDDVMQNHALAISKAIDKFDSDKGTLTAYINNWFQDARGSKNHYILMPDSVRLDGGPEFDNYADTFDGQMGSELGGVCDDMSRVAEDATDILERKQTVDWVRLIAKYADPQGLGRFSLGIGDVLSRRELMALSQHIAPM